MKKAASIMKKVINRIKELQIEDTFRFTGWIETRAIMSLGNALLAPSKYEGFMLSMVEAAIMRIPVLRTKTGGYKDFKNYVYPIESCEADDIVVWFKKVIADRECLKSKIEPAYEFAIKNCTIKTMTVKTVHVYERVLNNII